ncbi:MAG: SMI1/KNR4 family protein [Planctomycetales bacterium]|nr:SMI1/KNR4 family protein [Planctomycetales bacterium]
MDRIAIAYSKFCVERFRLPTAVEIARVESSIGTELPQEYRKFLLEYNGGVFSEPSISPQRTGCPDDSLMFLHGIGASEESGAELASSSDLALFSDNFPVEMLPIGVTTMNHLLILFTRGDDKGGIFLKPAFILNYFYLASSIGDFFSILMESER